MLGVPLSFTVATDVLRLLAAYRRTALAGSDCTAAPAGLCDPCAEPHLSRIDASVVANRELVFVLPAFPTKSPNRAKTLGPLPDMAERCALEFLQSLCDRIERIYPPGARFVICSDGRVFGDLIDVSDGDITDYHVELKRMIERLGADRLEMFDLDDAYPACDHDAMRASLIGTYGPTLAGLREEVLRGGEAVDLYRGMTRFLLEDRLGPHYQGTRTSAQREARARAYGVIQRSRAWGELVAERFPDAVRLSIHPQRCGTGKLGIRLMETPDDWLTPWHGVAVAIDGRMTLMKRADAERSGATLVRRGGRPSHYVSSQVAAISSVAAAAAGAADATERASAP
ncbi:L-tyrosine/L-tryptophan isonitrile synthase family protein [Pendulispora albinea]|uniref:Isocyanide synthase family protein n=1 Tax=Pendulispora albinea TaxID=2741071 RepID=A0ABZ2LKX3_9BACT